MADTSDLACGRREFVQRAASAAPLAAARAAVLAAISGKSADKAQVLVQIPELHAENLRRLQEWIALPSVAAENLNSPAGAEPMADLARQAGFSGVRLVPTSGKPGVCGKLKSGAVASFVECLYALA